MPDVMAHRVAPVTWDFSKAFDYGLPRTWCPDPECWCGGPRAPMCKRPGHDHALKDCPDEDEATGDLLDG